MSIDTEDPAYQRWLDETAKTCRCCAGCTYVPCPACCAGGICDETDCRCGDDYYAAVGNWWRDGGGLEPSDD